MATDPNYPDRPDHPDFWKISEALIAMDKWAETDMPLDQTIGVDPRSVLYAAAQRAQRAYSTITQFKNTLSMGKLLWMDGFAAGIYYAKIQATKNAETDGNRRKDG